MSRRSGFTGLMTAEAVSLFGSRMTFVAIPWLVLVTTGSATRTGVIAFAEMTPYVLALAMGGPLIDRIGPRRVSIAMDIASTVVVATIAALAQSHAVTFAMLVGLVALAGGARGLGDTSKRVLFPSTVELSGVSMTRATAINDGISRAATLVGAPLAGVLIATTSSATVLAVDAASFAVCAAIVGFAVRGVTAPTSADDDAADDGPKLSYFAQLREGARYARRDKLVLGIIVMLFITNLLDQSYGGVFVPVWAKNVFGSPLGIGLTAASFAAGAVAGNLVYLVVAPRLPRWAPFAVGFLLGGSPRFLMLALNTPLWSIVVVSFVAGVGLAAVNPILGAVMFERIPAKLQARVLGLSGALSWAGIPIGGILGGALADHTGVRTALLIGGALYLGATLLPFTSRVWRDMDSRPAPVPTSPVESLPEPVVTLSH